MLYAEYEGRESAVQCLLSIPEALGGFVQYHTNKPL